MRVKVRIRLTPEQAKKYDLGGDYIAGWSGNPIIDKILAEIDPSQWTQEA